MESNEYKTFNPLTVNPIDRLDEATESLDFLAGSLEQTATEDIDLMLVASRQRGLAHILDALRREVDDVTRFLDDKGVDQLAHCIPRRERKDAGMATVSLLMGILGGGKEEAQQQTTKQ